ncbi:Regulator of G-protein signaling 9 [Bagarius yarrelli]|uniref:Regulator of G-protein signaling 9 n=1 Tax=Bagarius yarrelli TaxID=175774 RepID=A0A556TIY7_BAGYA|nr:Regulator of G-protein signaling 9 [Bagarius yarrelli]
MEAVVLEMQDPKTGVKSQTQRLVITTIPHAITGEDIIEWISKRFKIDAAEARAFGTMMVAFGYIYPLQDHKRLVIRSDASLYRFQEQYNHLHKWMNHKWDFIVMQAKEQYRAGKERKKPDRVVFDCQERAYWVVHRPPPGTVSGMDYGLERLVDPNQEEIIFTQQCIMRPRVKSSVSIGALVKYTTTYKQHDPFLYPSLPSNPWLTDDVTYWNLNMSNVENPTKMRVERWTFSFGELLSDPRGRADFRLFLKKEFSGENLAFWEACEDLKWGAAATMQEKAQQIYKTFLARGAPRWINIDGKTMEITVKGLSHPHRYVLDAAQTHIYMLMKKDSYGRYLKSSVFKETQKKAVAPEPHRFSDAQLEQNAKKRRPSLSPIILRQQEEAQKAKLAATGPMDITQLCRFTAPVPHLAVYTGMCESQSTASPGLMTLPNSAVCPSPISVAIDSTPATERRFDGGAPAPSNFPSITQSTETSVSEENQPLASKSRVALSLSKILRRGCNAPSMFASLSPKCAVTAGGGRVQPLGVEQLAQPQPKRIANFFQIKVDIPPECRIYPIDSEDEEEGSPGTAQSGVKEIICPWETVTKHDGAGCARCLSAVTLAAQEVRAGTELSAGRMVSASTSGTAPSPQSEAMTSELQELSLQSGPTLLPLSERKNAGSVSSMLDSVMLDTNHCFHFERASFEDQADRSDNDKHPLSLDYDRHAYHSLKEVLQIKLQQRRTREELVSQGIMPPLKSPAAFHEQRKSLERARTEDYLKRKIRSRPERSELVRMHILEETSVEPSLQAKQLKLKRARLADDLNDKISHRPGPIELIHKNILPVPTLLETGSPKGENSSLDEDSSDGLSPEQPGSQDSPLGSVPQHSPSDMLNLNTNPSPTQFLNHAAPSLINAPGSSSPQNLTNETSMVACARPTFAKVSQSQSRSSIDRSTQRTKKPKENKPKVKKLKYHQYIPPDQKNDREPPPQLDSSYAKILHQQQLFLQLQIISQQQQHYNYHTILPAPPKLPSEQQPQQQQTTNSGPSPSRSVSSSAATTTPNVTNRSSQPVVGAAKPGVLPANLDEFKVAELKQALKLRGLTVSGTKNDLIERLKNYQEQNGGVALTAVGSGPVKAVQVPPQEVAAQSPTFVTGTYQSKDTVGKIAAYPIAVTSGIQTAALPQITRFNSTSSSPPVSPTPSERSVAGMSADETSCNGDVFGEMVSSPLTQLSLHPSSEHPSPVKEESHGQSSCCISHPTSVPSSADQPQEPSMATPLAPSAPLLDKDQMLQLKDKQIEQLTRMLRQKQQLVETLRSQLEQGKRGLTLEGMEIAVKAEDLALVSREVVLNHQTATQVTTSFPLDLLKAHPAPTLVTDGNGNHYLIALTSNSVDNRKSESPQKKANARITLQRMQSTPVKLPSQSVKEVAHPVNKSQQHNQTAPVKQPTPKVQNAGRHLHPSFVQESSQTVSTPFCLSEEPHPFIEPDSPTSLKGEVCPSFDRHTLFTPPSPKPESHNPHVKENGSNNHHIDDLFDILIKSGEISGGFKANPDPSLSELHSNPPSPPSSPLRLSPPSPPTDPNPSHQPPDTQQRSFSGSGRLEDFLESTTGSPLLGVEPDGPLTLIDDLHNQMLSTSSILDHPHSPMDTSDLSFSPHPTSLDFEDPVLDGMDWLDLSMGGGSSTGGTVLVPLSSHTPPSVFSADFLDSSELQLHWDSCL